MGREWLSQPGEHFHLLTYAGIASMKFQKQGMGFRKLQSAVGVHGFNLSGIHQLNSCDGYAKLQYLGYQPGGSCQIIECQPSYGGGFRNTLNFQRDFCNDAKGALGTDHQTGQVEARCGLACRSAGFNDITAGGNHPQAQHVFFHGAIAHRIGSGSPGCTHTTDRGIGARVHGKEQAPGCQCPVQLLACNPGLYPAQEIVAVDIQNLIHLRQVQTDAAGCRRCLTFQACAGAECGDRSLVFGAQLHDAADFAGGGGITHSLRGAGRMPGFIAAVVIKYRRIAGKTISQ